MLLPVEDEKFAQTIFPYLVEDALKGSESAIAALLYGLLESCQQSALLPDDAPPSLTPLQVLHDYALSALRPPGMSDYDGEVLYRHLFGWESIHILEFVLADCTGECKCTCQRHSGQLPIEHCKIPAVSLWEIFLPILRLQDPRLEGERETTIRDWLGAQNQTEIQEWLRDHNDEAWLRERTASSTQKKVLEFMYVRVGRLLEALERLRVLAETSHYKCACEAFKYIKVLAQNALCNDPEDCFFTCPAPEDVFLPNVHRVLTEAYDEELPLRRLSWQPTLANLSRDLSRERWPLPTQVALERVLRLQFKDLT